jgi:hypothetical protein
MDTFWGHSSTFWVAMEALGVWVYSFIVIITLSFIYQQVRTAAKSFQFDTICRLQQLVDDFREDRRLLFANCPVELALSQEQFADLPPERHHALNLDERHFKKLALTFEQTAALGSLSEDVRESAVRVIARLNDIGQLVEDGFINRRVFLGKYHVMIIQCCHLVEAIRRDEEEKRGGNYGHRLLRMRRWATTYNDICPKHRDAPIEITSSSKRRIVYKSPSPDAFRLITWATRRWLRRF